MSFSTSDEICAHYQEYGRHTGFGITSLSLSRDVNGEHKYQTFGCLHAKKSSNESQNLLHPRLFGRVGCSVHICASKQNDGRW